MQKTLGCKTALYGICRMAQNTDSYICWHGPSIILSIALIYSFMFWKWHIQQKKNSFKVLFYTADISGWIRHYSQELFITWTLHQYWFRNNCWSQRKFWSPDFYAHSGFTSSSWQYFKSTGKLQILMVKAWSHWKATSHESKLQDFKENLSSGQ